MAAIKASAQKDVHMNVRPFERCRIHSARQSEGSKSPTANQSVDASPRRRLGAGLTRSGEQIFLESVNS